MELIWLSLSMLGSQYSCVPVCFLCSENFTVIIPLEGLGISAYIHDLLLEEVHAEVREKDNPYDKFEL